MSGIEFKPIPYWVRPFLWFKPELISSDVERGRLTVVYSKKVFGVLYILRIDSIMHDCRSCGY